MQDKRCCGRGVCIINDEGVGWCGQRWDGEKIISAKSREDLIYSSRALDRVLLWGHYVIPQWHISAYRTLYWDIFDKPTIRPKYSLGTNTWWIDSEKAGSIKQRRKSIK